MKKFILKLICLKLAIKTCNSFGKEINDVEAPIKFADLYYNWMVEKQQES